jgi:hypothetical protein
MLAGTLAFATRRQDAGSQSPLLGVSPEIVQLNKKSASRGVDSPTADVMVSAAAYFFFLLDCFSSTTA